MSAPTTDRDDVLALSVHGSRGVVDLVVPSGASAADVAREYAAQARLTTTPALCTRRGERLAADRTLVESGVRAGALLVALEGDGDAGATARRRLGRRREQVAPARDSAERPGGLSAAWFTVAAGAALAAGWSAARLPASDPVREPIVWILAAATFLAVLPVGRFVAHRAVAAPAFGGAAAYVVAYSPVAERMPTVLGVSALTAAVVAAVARALDRRGEEALRVWMVTGVVGFVVSTAGALAGVGAPVVWSLLLVAAFLSTRFVPMSAVDVPDQYLIDIERLAVTAWSARERPRGRRGRIVVPRRAVATVAESGTRTIVAAAAAVLAVSALSAPLLLATATDPIDRIGARCLVGFAGGALLLAARSYRNTTARALLRVAGLLCWSVLAVVLFAVMGPTAFGWTIGVALGLAVLMVVVAVAVGRGWRSAAWSRRAEVAEGVTGAFAIGSVVVAVGLFRHLWELTGQGLGV